MTQNHVEPDVARALLIDMFPHLPSHVVLARFDSYPEPGAINDVIDDLMAYTVDCQDVPSGDAVMETSDNEDVDDDTDLKHSCEYDVSMKHQLVLMEMFPHFDFERMHRIIQTLGDNFDEAVTILVELADDDLSHYPEEVRILSDLCPLIPVSVLYGELVERNFLLDDVIRSVFPESNDVVQFKFQTNLNMADHIKFTSFKRMFPNGTEEVILQVMKSENNLYVRSLEALQGIFGPPAVKDDAVIEFMPVNDNSSHLPTQGANEEPDLRQHVVDSLDRLYSGKYEFVSDETLKVIERDILELSEQKSELRRRAQNAMSDRQMFHRQMLYERIRDLDDRINASREQLMVSFFIRNNPRAHEFRSIDLHGIYVREARRLVFDFISRAKLAFCGNGGKVSIIVGIGLHSTTTFFPKLRPAIIRLLRYLKLKFEVRSGEIIVLID